MRQIAIFSGLVLMAISATGLRASASTLPINAVNLTAQTATAAMCDTDVTITPIEVLGITASVTVSNISTDCFGWTLKVQITNSSGAPFGGGLSTVVDQTTESFLALSIGQIPGPNDYYWVLQPP